MADISGHKNEMTFWEHLEEFRKVIFRSAIVLILLMVVVFVNKNFVFDEKVNIHGWVFYFPFPQHKEHHRRQSGNNEEGCPYFR